MATCTFSQFQRKNPSSQNLWNVKNLNANPWRLWFHCAFWWCRLLHDSSTDFFVTISDKNNPQKKWGLSTSWQAGLLTVKKILLNTSPCRSVRFDAFFPHRTALCTMTRILEMCLNIMRPFFNMKYNSKHQWKQFFG